MLIALSIYAWLVNLLPNKLICWSLSPSRNFPYAKCLDSFSGDLGLAWFAVMLMFVFVVYGFDFLSNFWSLCCDNFFCAHSLNLHLFWGALLFWKCLTCASIEWTFYSRILSNCEFFVITFISSLSIIFTVINLLHCLHVILVYLLGSGIDSITVLGTACI